MIRKDLILDTVLEACEQCWQRQLLLDKAVGIESVTHDDFFDLIAYRGMYAMGVICVKNDTSYHFKQRTLFLIQTQFVLPHKIPVAVGNLYKIYVQVKKDAAACSIETFWNLVLFTGISETIKMQRVIEDGLGSGIESKLARITQPTPPVNETGW